MVGYQGWFTAPGDSANIGWYKYAKNHKLNNQVAKFDLWPDTSEYKKLYKTPIVGADGKPTYLFSSDDESTIDLHVKWMQQYGIDGAFVQRFFLSLHDATRQHHLKVLKNMLKYGNKYNRAISVMYDLSGLSTDKDANTIIEDWKYLVDSIHITSRTGNPYLYDHGKPVVALYGAGFAGRPDTFSQFEKIINFLKNDKNYGNCYIILGVPFYWRTLNEDSTADPRLHILIKKADYIFPWAVGRVRSSNLQKVLVIQQEDKLWCKKNNIGYMPLIYPGFSWKNTYNTAKLDEISRNGGKFFLSQIQNMKAIEARNVYVAMFDEIDEGTAIFKVSKNPPQNAFLKFVPLDKNLPNDYYMIQAGKLAKYLKSTK